MSANLTTTDLFAGAGGSSTGAASVPGVVVRIASNHWRKAVTVHNANHPGADHVCADISQINPRMFPGTDLLWASPECTNHTRAKGKPRETNQPDLFGEILPDEAAERSRATMWDIPRFAEVHRYKAVIVENVVEARNWLPFRAWLLAMDSYGYDHHIVYLNSMHAQTGGLPAPQSRDRMYVVFWRKGDRRPDFDRMQRPKAWCPTCDESVDAMQSWKNPARPGGRYRQQYVYRCPRATCRNQVVEPAWLPASSVIDWTLTGQRIGDRARPLKEKTLRRIAAGIERYWAPAADGTYQPILTPVEGREGKAPSLVTDPLRTQTTRSETGIAFPPFFAELRGGRSVARAADQPLSTVTASGKHHALVVPYYGATQYAKPASEALGTLTTRDRFAITTSGHQPLVTGTVPEIDDCTFRMLEPREIAAAMAFPGSYLWEGNRRERVRMAGNAVTPPAARDLVACVAAAITGEETT
jgi:DNA (cytosine-5)-methyltransferase 1